MAGTTDSKYKRYDPATDEAPASGGIFLRVEEGKSARFYLIDKGALSYEKEETDFNDRTKTVKRRKFLFLVLDMTGCNNKDEWHAGTNAEVKLLEAGPQIYNGIHNNVKEYDGDFNSALKLEKKKVGTKTEYNVIVVPKSEGDFSAGQQVVIESFLEKHDVTLANALVHFAEKYSGDEESDSQGGGGDFDPTTA